MNLSMDELMEKVNVKTKAPLYIYLRRTEFLHITKENIKRTGKTRVVYKNITDTDIIRLNELINRKRGIKWHQN